VPRGHTGHWRNSHRLRPRPNPHKRSTWPATRFAVDQSSMGSPASIRSQHDRIATREPAGQIHNPIFEPHRFRTCPTARAPIGSAQSRSELARPVGAIETIMRRNQRSERAVTGVRASQRWWPGTGSNRRPSDFQFQVHPVGVGLPGILLAVVTSQKRQKHPEHWSYWTVRWTPCDWTPGLSAHVARCSQHPVRAPGRLARHQNIARWANEHRGIGITLRRRRDRS
jgi:hypothetical protein